jgi:hypothetical protein
MDGPDSNAQQDVVQSHSEPSPAQEFVPEVKAALNQEPIAAVQNGSKSEDRGTLREKSKGTEIALVVLTFLTAVAAIWSAHIFQGQLTEARLATQQSTESFRIDERAWIEIEPVKPVLLAPSVAPNGGAAFTCDIYLKNFGKTVATEISVKAADTLTAEGFDKNAELVNRNQDNIPVEAVTSRAPKVLGPGATAAAPFRLTCQAPTTYESGHQAIHYLIGRIDYRDQFRVKHWLRFCYFVVNDRGEIWSCQEGNDEDHNSETQPD